MSFRRSSNSNFLDSGRRWSTPSEYSMERVLPSWMSASEAIVAGIRIARLFPHRLNLVRMLSVWIYSGSTSSVDFFS